MPRYLVLSLSLLKGLQLTKVGVGMLLNFSRQICRLVIFLALN